MEYTGAIRTGVVRCMTEGIVLRPEYRNLSHHRFCSCLWPSARIAFLVLAFSALCSCAANRGVMKPISAALTIRSGWCMIEDTRIHYVDTGDCRGCPTLVIVHGFLGSTFPFQDLIDGLSREMRVVMPDLPGFGVSEPPPVVCSMEYYLDFLESLFQHLNLGRVYLMGTSLGANIAAHYAAEHPNRVRALIFVSPFGLYDQGGRMTQVRRWDPLLPLASRLVTKSGVRRRLQRVIGDGQPLTPGLVDAFYKPFASAQARRATLEVTRHIIGGCSMDEYLPRIEQPVLILIGSADKLLCPGDCEKFRRLLAAERIEMIEGCGHFLYLDSPGVVTEKIVRFTRGGIR